MTNDKFRLDFNRLVTALTFIALFAMAIRYPADSDTWWHLRAGQAMLESGSLLTTDIFSHTRAGSLWINHGWLAQLFWYGLLAWGGLTALSLGLATLVTVTFWLVWRQSEGNLYVKAFGVILGAIASSIVWAARPQMVSVLFSAVAAFLLYRFKKEDRSLLPWYPLLVLVWVNCHGGFAVAFILPACYLAGEAVNRLTRPAAPTIRWRHLLVTVGLSLAVVGVNPHTWRLWLYPFQTVGIGVLRGFIAEWQSPNFHLPILLPFWLMVLLLLAAFAQSGRKVDWTDLALVGAWATLSMLAVRNVAIFAVVCTPILIRYTQAALEAQFGPLTLGRPRLVSPLISRVNALLLGLIVVAALAQIGVTLNPQALRKAEQEKFPAEAVAFLKAHPLAGPMFNSYNIGGYLMYHLPEYPVFVDGRTDLYNDEFLRAYLQTVNVGPDWEALLAQYHIRLVVLEKDLPLAGIIGRTGGWEEIYSDAQIVILRRL